MTIFRLIITSGITGISALQLTSRKLSSVDTSKLTYPVGFGMVKQSFIAFPFTYRLLINLSLFFFRLHLLVRSQYSMPDPSMITSPTACRTALRNVSRVLPSKPMHITSSFISRRVIRQRRERRDFSYQVTMIELLEVHFLCLRYKLTGGTMFSGSLSICLYVRTYCTSVRPVFVIPLSQEPIDGLPPNLGHVYILHSQ